MGKGWGGNYSGLGPPKFPNGRPMQDIRDDVRNGDQHRCIHEDWRGKRCSKDQISGQYYCNKHKDT